MTLLALGINHKTAPVSLRERVTFSPDTLDLALDSLLAQPMVQGGVVLSTCNRTELYLSVEEQDNLHEALIRWLCDYHNLNEDELRNSLYWHQDNDAVSHLMRVASGLDSLVLGEPQILGQVKKAFADSQKGHLKASELERMFQRGLLTEQELNERVIEMWTKARDEVAKADAVLKCWYPGQEGGQAVAEALLGEINPGAKLPVSVVRNAGQIPLFYNHKPSARRGYLFDDKAPLFPFGHGLSYTSFDWQAPTVDRSTFDGDGLVTVRVRVTNSGTRPGSEVVQIYVTPPTSHVVRPVKELRAFAKLHLAPDETGEAIMTLSTVATLM